MMLIGSLGTARPAEIGGFSVQGDLVYKAYAADGAVRAEMRRTFSASINGCRWLIRTTPVSDDPKNEATRFYEVGTDGANTYKVISPNQDYEPSASLLDQLNDIEARLNVLTPSNSAHKSALLANHVMLKKALTNSQHKTQARNDAVAEIIPGMFPVYDIDFALPIWLAYASECYFDRMGSETAPRMWNYEHPLQKFTNNTVKVQMQRTLMPPLLPTEVIFFNDGKYYDAGNYTGAAKTMEALRLPEPYSDGYTNAIYHVRRMTNFSGFEIPSQFSLRRYERINGARKSSDLQLESTFDCILTRVDSAAATNFVPTISSATSVTDSRFFRVENAPHSVVYDQTSAAWPTIAEVQATTAYQRGQLKNQLLLRRQQIKRRRQLIIVVGLGVCLIVPIILLSRFAHNQPQEIHQTRNHI